MYSWGCSRKALGRSSGGQEEPSRVKGAIEEEYISSVASGEYFPWYPVSPVKHMVGVQAQMGN